MKEVAEEENLVALKSLIETAEKVLASNFNETLQKQVGLNKKDNVKNSNVGVLFKRRACQHTDRNCASKQCS